MHLLQEICIVSPENLEVFKGCSLVLTTSPLP